MNNLSDIPGYQEARRIRTGQRTEKMLERKKCTMIILYSRYSVICSDEERDTLEEAKDCLQAIEDEGEGYALGVYDPATHTMHIPQNMNIAGQPEGAVLLQKQEEFRKLGFEINTIEFYD